MPESPGAEKQDKEKDHRDSKKSRGERLTAPWVCDANVSERRCSPATVMKTSLSMDTSDQKKTRMKLKKFLIRRPTYQAVRDKGYIKGSARPPPAAAAAVVPPLAPTCAFADVHRSGVRQQPDQSVPAGEHTRPQLCQNVHRARGEHRYDPGVTLRSRRTRVS